MFEKKVVSLGNLALQDALGNKLRMNWIIILVVITVEALSIVSRLPKKSQLKQAVKETKKPTVDVAYERRSLLFTPAEKLFYEALSKAVSDDQLVFGKVRVADVLQPASSVSKSLSKSQWQTAFNRISAKHFDYVICDKNTLSIVATVELHDKSHNSASRSTRDQFLRQACKSAGLPLFEFRAKSAYVAEDISAAMKMTKSV